jgi:hypothetical protein
MTTAKRYAIMIQHEIIIYAPTEEAAKATAVRNHYKVTCVAVRELKSIEDERSVLIDNRKAPGS